MEQKTSFLHFAVFPMPLRSPMYQVTITREHEIKRGGTKEKKIQIFHLSLCRAHGLS